MDLILVADQFTPSSSDKLFFDSIRYRYDMRVFFSIRYDTIRYEGLKEDLLFEEFSANFRRIFRIFGEFSEFSANFLNFRRIFGEFSEFSANFWNFRRKKTKKSLVLRISRFTIWEVRYDILFDIRKSPISRHSINSRYDKLLTVRNHFCKITIWFMNSFMLFYHS